MPAKFCEAPLIDVIGLDNSKFGEGLERPHVEIGHEASTHDF